MQIILDVGSGNSLGSDPRYTESVVNAIKEVDSGKHEVILKAQLFQDQPPNKPLRQLVFDRLYDYGAQVGYKVTASVFDIPSLKFLLNYEAPFIKIACRPDLYWLMGEVPRKVPLYVSYAGNPGATQWGEGVTWLFCIPHYPARKEDYLIARPTILSDHTEGLDLFKELKPTIWEKHFVLEREADNPDAGPFAIGLAELKEIL